MTVAWRDILASPRLAVWHERIGRHLRAEAEARRRFREQMNEDTRAEFINGEVVVHSPARQGHNRTAERIHFLLKAYVETRGLGQVGHEKYLVELTRNDVEPDVVYWEQEKARQFTAEQLIFPPPDLVVEVLSETTEALDRGVKFEDYAAHGVREYWIVDAGAAVLEQYVLAGETYRLQLKSGDGTVRCTAIEGGTFPVRALFDDAENRMAVEAALRRR